MLFLEPSTYIKGDYSNEISNNHTNNKHQTKAINELNNNIEIIHGPPGTGKTTLIMDIINNKVPQNHKILCTAIQNQAINTIVDMLIKNNYNDIIVFGNPAKLSDEANKYNYHVLSNNDVVLKELKNKKEILDINLSVNECIRQKYDIMTKEIETITKLITNRKKLLTNKRIIISTIDSCHILNNLTHDRIDTLIVDEAGATTEMNLLSLFVLMPTNLLLVGDHKQLSAFSYSHIQADEQYHNLSLLERFIDAGRKHNMLKKQYRMPSDICNLVSNTFYNGLLYTHKTKISTTKNIEWFDIEGIDNRNEKFSFYNLEEVEQINEICKMNKDRHILVLTFYNAQLYYLTNKLKQYSNVICKTIDSSQGMEYDIIIISLVASINKNFINKYQSNKKRICVALSRAQNKLYIVGNKKLFNTNNLWNNLIKNI